MRDSRLLQSTPSAYGGGFSAANNPIGASSILLPSSGLLDTSGLPMTRTGNKMLAIAANEAMSEQCYALIAKTTLDNVAVLTACEEHLCCVAPGGAERYKAIVDQYTLSALQRMVRR